MSGDYPPLWRVYIASIINLKFLKEFADVTENVLKLFGNSALITVLQDSKVLPYFRSLSVRENSNFNHQ